MDLDSTEGPPESERKIKDSIQTFWNTSETYVSEKESCLVVWGGLGWEHKQADLLKNHENHRKYQWKSWTLSGTESMDLVYQILGILWKTADLDEL